MLMTAARTATRLRFAIDWATGQLMTKAALNYEDIACTTDDNVYTVVVRATDPSGVPQAATADDKQQRRGDGGHHRHGCERGSGGSRGCGGDLHAETTGDITAALDTYTATDQDDGAPTPTWSVAGPDGDKFTAVGGELKFKAKPDYENATDANTGQRVRGDGAGLRRQAHRNEEGEGHRRERGRGRGGDPVEDAAPGGIAVTASLTDPDGSISSLTWQWSDHGPSRDNM